MSEPERKVEPGTTPPCGMFTSDHSQEPFLSRPLACLAVSLPGLVVIHIVLIVHGVVVIVVVPGIAEADVIKAQVIGAIEAE